MHGEEQVARAEHASSLLFGEDIATLAVDDVLAVFEDVPSTELRGERVRRRRDRAWSIWWRACSSASSKSEARRLVQSGGVYVNNRRVSDPQARLTREQAIGGRLFVLRKGPEAESSGAADLTAARIGTRYSLNVRTAERPAAGDSARRFLGSSVSSDLRRAAGFVAAAHF